MTNPVQYIIFGGILTGLSLAACVALADGPGTPGTFDQCVAGDCKKPKVYWCDAHSKLIPADEYRAGDCKNHEREEREPEQEPEREYDC